MCRCFIIPPTILHAIAQSSHVAEETRQVMVASLEATEQLREGRCAHCDSMSEGPHDHHGGDAAGAPPTMQSIIPPQVQEAAAAESETSAQSLLQDEAFRAGREAAAKGDAGQQQQPPKSHLYRIIYTANNTDELQMELVRKEGGPPVVADASGDPDEAYGNLKATYDFFRQKMGRDSIDGKGMKLKSTVHYLEKYQNAFWDGKQMVFGDGDGVIFNDFTDQIDVVAHELTHGVTTFTANLAYRNQSGALNESMSDVFGSMVKQFHLDHTAEQADWLIGEGIFTEAVKGKALRSMKDPGTAYDDPKVGRDEQPAHMRQYVRTTRDQGGVHINSGIPNKAFYLAAVALGGYAWERAGKIWYDALTGGDLKSSAQFLDFANLTVKSALKLFDAAVAKKIVAAWDGVGITTTVDVPDVPEKKPQEDVPKKPPFPGEGGSGDGEL